MSVWVFIVHHKTRVLRTDNSFNRISTWYHTTCSLQPSWRQVQQATTTLSHYLVIKNYPRVSKKLKSCKTIVFLVLVHQIVKKSSILAKNRSCDTTHSGAGDTGKYTELHLLRPMVMTFLEVPIDSPAGLGCIQNWQGYCSITASPQTTSNHYYRVCKTFPVKTSSLEARILSLVSIMQKKE